MEEIMMVELMEEAEMKDISLDLISLMIEKGLQPKDAFVNAATVFAVMINALNIDEEEAIAVLMAIKGMPFIDDNISLLTSVIIKQAGEMQ